MKKQLLFCLLTATVTTGTLNLNAQNRSINFAPEDITAEEMFAQAREQGKIIFMDCYASWCGPCKMMAKDVFTIDRVADFFNENFYCVKFDMEVGEGLKLNKTYGVSAYPTFLFIDPKTEFLVHTMIGARPADDFIAGAKEALNPDLSMEKAKNTYENSPKTPDTVNDYLTVLGKAQLTGIMNSVAVDYLAGKTKEELAQMDNWGIFMRGVSDIYSEPMQLVFNNRAFFEQAIGAGEVTNKTYSALYSATREFVHSKAVGPDPDFNKNEFDRMKAFVEASGDPYAPAFLLQMKACEANQNEDYATVLDCLYENLEKNLIPESAEQYFRASNIARLTQITDKKLQKRATKYFEDAFKACETDLDRANILRMKGIIFEQWGDEKGSAKAMEESMVWGRKNAQNR